ncbi:uncharacterized protein EKO05_0000404 [Ascochyta rabiei]|uniref:Cis-stilbene-oxide hydrolase n=1 Tax=Didymella rabiei TaxID=5454 RepID=A0A163BS92_DIDRA|nr:uncharacterized protein EKO05_0000404 [Ascochyta rabiei]KZM21947.1 cis-stilbene-oxide hydrolase [Ascochyta rabiei]UPX09720.1 hypothetical protein EKO05_0000404 [Ascochyta rabiei]
MSELKPFDPNVPQEEVDRLFRKLRDTRLPDIPVVPDAGDDYGPSLEWINKLKNFWQDKYSWPDAQKQISEWHHFTTEMDNLKVHFIHEKARKRQKDAIPLLLVHGWPGTFFEFQNVMHPLLDPKDDAAPVFDLVVPSLPGFCWSQGPPRGWTLQDTARIFDVLMKRLGYNSYAAQAGDWGHWVVRELGSGRYNACKAVHTNMCPGAPPKGYKMNEKEQAAMDRAKWWMGEHLYEGHMGYAIEMRTRPQTIGVAFNDNPVGIMMFIGEKYDELADPTIGTATLDKEEYVRDVCTTLSLYFFTPPSIMTSMLCYYNNVRHEVYTEFNAKEENLIRVPLGVSTFPYDAFPVPKAGVETTATNLKFFREREHGGHFACMEMHEEMVTDMRDFFGEFYKA